MIIEKVNISIFGGLSNRELDLQEGMNVVLGPNESGKSTIYKAIENALFTPSRLTPARFKKQMGYFIPIGGGDTIEVSIDFKSQGRSYKLRRRWGASDLSSLTLPNGSVVTDDEAVRDVIRECLQVPEGTCKTVMMAYQTGLSITVHNIRENKETLEHLGNILRKAVMELDGVSVDAFRTRIEDAYASFFGRWDININYPEGNRGIEDPWVRNVGSITQSFYEKEAVRIAFEVAVDYEKELDELNKRISEHAIEVGKIQLYVKNNKPLKEDAVKRKQIEAELKGFALEFEKLEKVNKDWPVTESKINERKQKLPDLEDKEKKLSEEKQLAETYRKGKDLLDNYKRAKAKKHLVDEAEKRLEKVINLTDHDLKSIRAAYSVKSKLEASLSAGKLSARFKAKKDNDLEIQEGLNDRIQSKLKAGEVYDFKADGRLQFLHHEWELEVTSGEVDYKQILDQYENAKATAEDLLHKFNAKSLEEAEALNAIFKMELGELERAKHNLEEELGELTYEELMKKAEGLNVKKPDRELETVLTELANTKAEIRTLKAELTELQKTLLIYIEEYGDQHKLLERLAEISGLIKQRQEALSKLRTFPAEIQDVDRFIVEYEAVETHLGELTQEHNNLIQESIRLEGQAPERSAEEIARDLADAEERFGTELRKGMAVAKIRDTMEGLLASMDSATYKGLEKDVSDFLQKMTGGRYQDVVMEESLPSGFHRKDGVLMPYDNLSTGTKDVLGIALRLAITKQFLDNKEGFVIMDDPLVDLDPNRQSMVADAIKDFAEDKQIILLTCHPSHAELLGGNKIELKLL